MGGRVVLWLLALAALAGPFAIERAAAAPTELNLRPLEDVPVQHMGRKKPFYAFARDSWSTVHGRSVWRDEDRVKWSPMESVVDIWMRPGVWSGRPVILVDYVPLLEEMGTDITRKHYSLEELSKNDVLVEKLEAVMALRERDPAADLDRMQEAVRQTGFRMEVFQTLLTGGAFRLIPHPTRDAGTWLPVIEAPRYFEEERLQTLGASFESMVRAYREGDEAAWSASLDSWREEAAGLVPEMYPSASIMALEHAYLQFHPFRLAWMAFLLAGFALVVTSMAGQQAGYRIAWGFALTGFLLMCAGFVARTIISGRPPVTNMYETVIWLAFGVILFALVFEAKYRARYFLLAAVPVAVLSLILADTQPTILDPAIHPLVPVLRSNFWLVIHVLTITTSYAAFALALGVAHIIMFKILARGTVGAALFNYLYRTLLIGVLLLGAGTILGGVWANYSWGRFWGWDPKETWALIAFLSYLAVLHGRIAGWWGGFGLTFGAVVGFQTILMAWYGVNFILGTGLHSYGFGTGGFPYVLAFVIAELILLGFVTWTHLSCQPGKREPVRA